MDKKKLTTEFTFNLTWQERIFWSKNCQKMKKNQKDFNFFFSKSIQNHPKRILKENMDFVRIFIAKFPGLSNILGKIRSR